MSRFSILWCVLGHVAKWTLLVKGRWTLRVNGKWTLLVNGVFYSPYPQVYRLHVYQNQESRVEKQRDTPRNTRQLITCSFVQDMDIRAVARTQRGSHMLARGARGASARESPGVRRPSSPTVVGIKYCSGIICTHPSVSRDNRLVARGSLICCSSPGPSPWPPASWPGGRS